MLSTPPRSCLLSALATELTPVELGGFLLVIFGHADSVLTTREDMQVLPGEAGRFPRGVALLRGKLLAARLIPRHAPEVWAAVLPADGRNAACATSHALVACAPRDDAPPSYCWLAAEALVAAQQEAAQWLAAAADAVAAVRSLPSTTAQSLRSAAGHGPAAPMAQLVRDADRANALLRDHCERTAGPAWQPNLFRS
jgi:hypothetical protein